MTAAGSLLIVDDDPAFRERLVRALRDRGYEVQRVADHTAAIAAREDSPEFAPVDLRLPGESGLAVVRDLKALDASTVVVVLTGYGSIATAVESMKLGAASYLTKPADADQIVAAFAGVQPAETRKRHRWRASNGNISTGFCSIAAETSPRPRALSAFIAVLCSANSRKCRFSVESIETLGLVVLTKEPHEPMTTRQRI